MYQVNSTDTEKVWVIAPIRELVDASSAKEVIKKKLTSLELEFVSTYRNDETIDVAFSNIKGFDFAQTLLREHSQNNLIYIEKKNEDYIYIHIQNSHIAEDRLISKRDLLQSIELQVDDFSNNTSEYCIYHYNCDEEILSKISKLGSKASSENGEANITKISLPLTESLDGKIDYEFNELQHIQRRLSVNKQVVIPKKVIALLAVVLFYVIFYVDFSEPKVVTVYNDPFKKYRTLLTKTLPEVDTRLLQAFNLHQTLKNIPGWQLVKVVFNKTSHNPQFKMKRSQSGSLQGLETYASKYGLSVFHDQSDTFLQTLGANVPPFDDSDLKVYSIDKVYANTKDVLSQIAPHIDMVMQDTIIYDPTQSQWETRRLALNFKAADMHDLLKLSAVFKGVPVTLEQADYTVKNGLFKGVIIVQLHGKGV